jgi:hypothetical protein
LEIAAGSHNANRRFFICTGLQKDLGERDDEVDSRNDLLAEMVVVGDEEVGTGGGGAGKLDGVGKRPQQYSRSKRFN